MIYVANLLVTFLVISTLFGVIFKVLPDAVIKWRDVITGSMVTAVLFMLGKFAITYYIGRSNVGGTYGAAGSLVVLLLWVYYSSVILYFGAEFTKAYAAKYGSVIHPSPWAVWVKNIEVEEKSGSLKEQEQKKKRTERHDGRPCEGDVNLTPALSKLALLPLSFSIWRRWRSRMRLARECLRQRFIARSCFYSYRLPATATPLLLYQRRKEQWIAEQTMIGKAKCMSFFSYIPTHRLILRRHNEEQAPLLQRG